MYLYSKTKITSLAIILTMLTGCGGGSATSSGSATTSTETAAATSAPAQTATPIPTATPAPATKAVHKGQVKDSSTGSGLENVKVSIGESTTTTDADGFYTLSGLTETEKAVVNFEKEGYLLGSTHIKLKSLSADDTTSPNYLEYNMHLHNNQWDYDSTEDIAGGHIAIDSATYIDTEGNPYSGITTAELTILDITSNKGKSLFPGAFKGINTNGVMVQFDSCGLISFTLKDNNGNKVSLSNSDTVTLTFHAVSSLEKPDTLPLWYYDYKQGLWFEEGYAELQEDGTYVGEVSQLGTWSLNQPLENEPGIYRGHIVDENGLPVNNVRVYAKGDNWISHDLSTDEDGLFEIEVTPDSNFHLSAYNYDAKYGAAYNIQMPAIQSGEIVED